MTMTSIADVLAEMDNELIVTVAKSASELRDAFRLRHQVYCIERGFEPDRGGMEIDCFDRNARHVLLRKRISGEAIGTVRMVPFDPETPSSSFPLQAVCHAPELGQLPLATTAEFSRFSLSKDRRGNGTASSMLMRLALIQGVFRVSSDAGLTHFCAVMERCLLRLLQATSIHFQMMGPPVEFHGIRQPVFTHVGTMLDRVAAEKPVLWEFLSAGTVWGRPQRERIAA